MQNFFRGMIFPAIEDLVNAAVQKKARTDGRKDDNTASRTGGAGDGELGRGRSTPMTKGGLNRRLADCTWRQSPFLTFSLPFIGAGV